MRTMLRSKVTLLLIVCAALLAIGGTAMALTTDTSGTTSTASPTIQSDKADYPPGAAVTLTGSNWQPGESVHIYVNDDEGQTWDRNVDVTADQSGNISDSFNLPDWFVATYKVTATGAQSGVATTYFTDGNVDAKANLPAGVTTSVQYEKYNQNSDCTGNIQTSGTKNLSGSTAVTVEGATSVQSVKMTAALTSSDGKTFVKW